MSTGRDLLHLGIALLGFYVVLLVTAMLRSVRSRNGRLSAGQRSVGLVRVGHAGRRARRRVPFGVTGSSLLIQQFNLGE